MMRKTRKTGLIISLLVFGAFLLSYTKTLAQEVSRFITVVNPVRISFYNTNPAESLKSEYSVIKENNLPATWLFTYDSLSNKDMLAIVKSMDNNQEFGIFLEVTKNFASGAGVEYHDTGFWHHASGVFLSGYSQDERRALIDTVFEKFKSVFGYFPTSIGSWWTDSYSLTYIKEKYGITANLTCSDQFSTDGYKIWGQYWSIPFYPSKYHAGIPASSESVKLDLVTIQWAPRDPFNGYYNSRFSTQDYPTAPKPQGIDYFNKLIDLYLQNGDDFGQVTVGLEADLGPSVYRDEFLKQMSYVKKLRDSGKVGIVTMETFSRWYKLKYPDLSPETLIKSEDFLGTGMEATWYQSPNYRLFYTKDINNDEIIIRDLRVYRSHYQEPYYISPNRSFNLSIYVPSVFDEINWKDNIWKLPSSSEIVFFPDKFKIKTRSLRNPKNNLLKLIKLDKEYEITFLKGESVVGEGISLKGFSSEAVHFLKQKKAVFYLLSGRGWNYFKKVDYLVSQDEMVALEFLAELDRGKVMVYDNECLQCEYHTNLKPAAFANQRKYVAKYGKHQIFYNSSVFKAKTRKEAKEDLQLTNAKYVYLVKFESYKEELPFSPGDLGVEKIFDNANVEIWRVIE